MGIVGTVDTVGTVAKLKNVGIVGTVAKLNKVAIVGTVDIL